VSIQEKKRGEYSILKEGNTNLVKIEGNYVVYGIACRRRTERGYTLRVSYYAPPPFPNS
jgi:hypothetical protein